MDIYVHPSHPIAITSWCDNLKYIFQLYGELDPSSKQWTDGLLTKILHTCTSSKNSTVSAVMLGECDRVQPWLVLDGAFDKEWIPGVEALLDQQNKLTLENGKELFLRGKDGLPNRLISCTTTHVLRKLNKELPIFHFRSQPSLNWVSVQVSSRKTGLSYE